MNVVCNHATLKSDGQYLACTTCPVRWLSVEIFLQLGTRSYRLAGEPESAQVTRLQHLVDYLEKRVEEEWLRAERKEARPQPRAISGDCPVGRCGGPSSEKRGHCLTLCIVCWADTLQKAADLVPEEDVATRAKFAEYIADVRRAITVNDVTPRRPAQPVEKLKQALRAAEEMLSLCETPVYPSHPEVKALCERLGYGLVMTVAANEWAQELAEKGLSGGNYTIGPCETDVERVLAKIREVL